MKGIVLAAGKGSRLYPITKPVCKPLLPIYDKPMIYYPISVLLQAGIKEILVIIPPDEQEVFEKLLGDGSSFGAKISYKEQHIQRGIADAFIIGREFIGDDSVCLALGDNIFYGTTLTECLKEARAIKDGAVIFGYYVEDPRAFGVVEFDENGKAISIEEKPQNPKSNYIVPGLYFYDNKVVDIAANIKPSARGELEITDVNNAYLKQGNLNVVTLGEDFTWFDSGTADGLIDAGATIRKIQKSTGKQVSCLEEIAYEQGYITYEELRKVGTELDMTNYGKYLLNIKER